MTAMLLLEALNFHNPAAHVKEFEYRATNPLYVNRALTIKGTWVEPTKARVWCEDEDDGYVGMTGLITVAQ